MKRREELDKYQDFSEEELKGGNSPSERVALSFEV